MFKLSVIAVAMILGALSVGCNTYQPVQFSVRDAETGKPIAKAMVGVEYFYVLYPFPPKDASIITDEHGDATMSVVTNCSRQFNASAEGFIPLEQRSYNGPADKGVELFLYRTPQPTVEVVVPDGYRGLLTINMDPTESRIQEAPGKRHFVLHASAQGTVYITTSPMLQRLPRNWDFPLPVRYEDGKKIPDRDDHNVRAHDVAVRFIGDGRDNQLLYVIGTEADSDRIDKRLRDARNWWND